MLGEPIFESDEVPPRRAWWRRSWRLSPFLLLGVGALASAAFIATFGSESTREVKVDVAPVVSTAVAKALNKPAISVAVYQQILPSLVYIQTEDNRQSDGGFGVGSGVVVNEDGSILTANHVVDGSSSVHLTFADGSRSDAEIVSSDPQHDLAVIKPTQPPDVIVPAVLAGSGRVQIGDEAFAVGNPLGLTGSLSAGVISGLDRRISEENGSGTLEGLIQFDAAVNPGNSGGPLLNRAGQVIGIVTALANPSKQDSFTGIGFAVPLEAAGGGGGNIPR